MSNVQRHLRTKPDDFDGPSLIGAAQAIYLVKSNLHAAQQHHVYQLAWYNGSKVVKPVRPLQSGTGPK